VLWLRASIRVLVRLSSGELVIPSGGRGGDAVYDFVRGAAPWGDVLPLGATFSVDARVWDCEDLPSDFLAATRAKDAVCDALRGPRGGTGGREKPPPPPPGSAGDVPLYLSCYRGRALLYRDLCGVSLHKRGYRGSGAIHRAALNESVAAGVLALAGWRGAPPGLHAPGEAPHEDAPAVLVDPMCGSGTFLVEGALMAGGVAPGLLRADDAWPFTRWPDHDASAWAQEVDAARAVGAAVRAAQRVAPVLLGADVHAGALALAASAAQGAGLERLISLTASDVRRWAPALPRGVAGVTHCVTNPPWGGRLQGGGAPAGSEEGGGDSAERQGGDDVPFSARDVSGESVPEGALPDTWFALGQFLKQRCGGASAAVLCGNRDVAAKLFLPPKRRHPLTVGGVDCRLLHFKLLPPKPPRAATADAPTAAASAPV
jgi:23S rRNA G2445 N2-methylase RlmL